MSVPLTQAQANHDERQSARAEADEQRFFDHRDDLARAVKAAQLRNDQAAAQLNAEPFLGKVADRTDAQREEDLLLCLERLADLVMCGEDDDVVDAALRLVGVR